jgi:hypothetical protein
MSSRVVIFCVAGWLASSVAEITHEEALCILKDKKLLLFGDSITRYAKKIII